MNKLQITLPFPPVTKKNSQRILRRKNGGVFIAPSIKYVEYERKAVQYLQLMNVKVDTFPVNVRAVFYMSNARKCDLVNLLEALDDVLVKAGILPDDNYTIIATHDGSIVEVDRDEPRTEVEITKTVHYLK